MAISSRLESLRTSLRARILALVGIMLALGALLLSFAAWEYAKVAARDAYDKLLIGGAVQIAENVYVQGGVVALDPPAAAFSTLSAYDLVFYRVTDPRGVVVAGYDDLAKGVGGAALHRGVVLRDGTYQGQPVRIAALGKQLEDAGGGWAEIVLAQTMRAREALAWDLTTKAVALIAVMSLLGLLATALSLGLAFSPLTRLEGEIAGRRPDDLRPIQVSPPREVRALVGAIDGFMRRLEERIAMMQRFIADAAHQIRTPLAAIDAEAELLSDELDDPARMDPLRNRIADVGRLASQLLDHAMVLHRMETARLQPVELNALAKSVLAQTVPLSLEREVSITFVPAPGEVTIAGDPISLREAIANLIHNAVVHGARARLAVEVGGDQAHAVVTVGDDGPGIPDGERERLCAPFQRGEGSHGSGLGLAIAAEVARAHGGGIRFETREGLFCVSLVLAVAPAREA